MHAGEILDEDDAVALVRHRRMYIFSLGDETNNNDRRRSLIINGLSVSLFFVSICYAQQLFAFCSPPVQN